MRKLIILAAIALCVPAISQAKTLEELLADKGVITKAEARNASTGNARVSWNGGTNVEFPDTGFSMKFATYVQTRYEFTDPEEGSNTSSFSVNKARIIISGTALNNEFSYYLQPDFVGDSDEDGSADPSLKDAYFTWHACDWASARMGQGKTPFSRQYNTSSRLLQFPDRSIASDYFDFGRQAGLLGTFSADDSFKIMAGIFNGTSDGEGENLGGVDTDHMGTVSFRWNAVGDINSLSEGDVEWTEDMGVSVGGTYAYSKASNDVGLGAEDTDLNSISVDANMKYQGWSVHGEFFWSQFDADSFASGGEVEPLGFYAQVGYMVMPKELEIAGRYAMVDCDNGIAGGDCSGNDDVSQVTAGLNYYWWGHNLKAQAAYDYVNADPVSGSSESTNRWILQLSGWF